MRTGITSNRFVDRIEQWNGVPINFPVYGITNVDNYVPFIFLQYHYNLRYDFVDLRDKIGRDPEKLDTSDQRDYRLRIYCAFLELYGLP